MTGFDVEAALNGLKALIETVPAIELYPPFPSNDQGDRRLRDAEHARQCLLTHRTCCVQRPDERCFFESQTRVRTTDGRVRSGSISTAAPDCAARLERHVQLVSGYCGQPQVTVPFVGNAPDFIGAVAVMADTEPTITDMSDGAVIGRWRAGSARPGNTMGKSIPVPIVSVRNDAIALSLGPSWPQTTIAISDQAIPDSRISPSAAPTRVEIAAVGMETTPTNADGVCAGLEAFPAPFTETRDDEFVRHHSRPYFVRGIRCRRSPMAARAGKPVQHSVEVIGGPVFRFVRRASNCPEHLNIVTAYHRRRRFITDVTRIFTQLGAEVFSRIVDIISDFVRKPGRRFIDQRERGQAEYVRTGGAVYGWTPAVRRFVDWLATRRADGDKMTAHRDHSSVLPRRVDRTTGVSSFLNFTMSLYLVGGYCGRL